MPNLTYMHMYMYTTNKYTSKRTVTHTNKMYSNMQHTFVLVEYVQHKNEKVMYKTQSYSTLFRYIVHCTLYITWYPNSKAASLMACCISSCVINL